MPTQELLAQLLAEPTPATLWVLRGELLAAGTPRDAPALIILNEFYHFLNELVASSTARQYSHFASLLDMGAVAGVAVQNLMEVEDSEGWLQRLVVGGVSEALMVFAARQYVKAWEEEMNASYSAAAWYLYEEFWHLSAELQPELLSDVRTQLVEQLVLPIRDEKVGGTVKAAVIVHFFQLLLMARLNMSD